MNPKTREPHENNPTGRRLERAVSSINMYVGCTHTLWGNPFSHKASGRQNAGINNACADIRTAAPPILKTREKKKNHVRFG